MQLYNRSGKQGRFLRRTSLQLSDVNSCKFQWKLSVNSLQQVLSALTCALGLLMTS